MPDIQAGTPRFVAPYPLEVAIRETEAFEPVVAGDFGAEGYRREFEEAEGYLNRIS